MRYSEAFINRTKAKLLEHNGKLSRRIAALNKEHDTQVESYRKVVEENKRLQNELAEASEKVNSAKHEIAGVRVALNREAGEAQKWRTWYDDLKTLWDKVRKERDDLKHVADDLEKQRKEAVQNFETASRRNDELQDRVNMLQRRWTDEFSPEDEMLGRKVLEWQEINVALAKRNIENAMVLDAELDTLNEYRKVLDKHGVMGPPYLDRRLSQSCPEEYMKVLSKYGIDSAEALDDRLSRHKKLTEAIVEAKCRLPAIGYLAEVFR
jgi:chromosome segregation ATPase